VVVDLATVLEELPDPHPLLEPLLDFRTREWQKEKAKRRSER